MDLRRSFATAAAGLLVAVPVALLPGTGGPSPGDEGPGSHTGRGENPADVVRMIPADDAHEDDRRSGGDDGPTSFRVRALGGPSGTDPSEDDAPGDGSEDDGPEDDEPTPDTASEDGSSDGGEGSGDDRDDTDGGPDGDPDDGSDGGPHEEPDDGSGDDPAADAHAGARAGVEA